jgi:hypothetical protein
MANASAKAGTEAPHDPPPSRKGTPSVSAIDCAAEKIQSTPAGNHWYATNPAAHATAVTTVRGGRTWIDRAHGGRVAERKR